jgi:hypothetical protein
VVPFLILLQVSGLAPSPTLPLRADFYVDEDLTYAVRPPRPPPPREWALPAGFGRIQVGLGPPGFSPETSLLRLEGYGGAKLWIEVDGGYMISPLGRHLGGAVWGGIGRWFSPGNASTPAFTEIEYLIGLEAPVRFGTRVLSVLAAPRLGVTNGTFDLGGTNPFRPAFVGGGQVSAVSSRYHLSVSASYLTARVPTFGPIAHTHDLGGLFFSLGAIFDDR